MTTHICLKYKYAMKLKDFRKLKHWTLEQLAKQLEISIPHVWMLENGERKPSIELAAKIKQLSHGDVNFEDYL